jgi:hypothetical protein
MTFESKEAAIKYAESQVGRRPFLRCVRARRSAPRLLAQGLHYTVDDAHEKKLKPKAYSDNFASKFYGIRPTKK